MLDRPPKVRLLETQTVNPVLLACRALLRVCMSHRSVAEATGNRILLLQGFQKKTHKYISQHLLFCHE